MRLAWVHEGQRTFAFHLPREEQRELICASQEKAKEIHEQINPKLKEVFKSLRNGTEFGARLGRLQGNPSWGRHHGELRLRSGRGTTRFMALR